MKSPWLVVVRCPSVCPTPDEMLPTSKPTSMETFAPGDRVVAINTDMSRPLCGPANPMLHPFLFPNGPLRRGVIYHVASVTGPLSDGYQGVFLTGIRVFWGNGWLSPQAASPIPSSWRSRDGWRILRSAFASI